MTPGTRRILLRFSSSSESAPVQMQQVQVHISYFLLLIHFQPSSFLGFVSGKMSKSKQMNVWADLAGLGVEEEMDPVETKRNNTSTSAFLEAVSENIEIEKFQNSKLQVLPFHFEQEIKKIDKKGRTEPALNAVSLENLKRTLDDGNNILNDLEKYEQFSNDVGSSEPIIGELIKVSEEMNDNIEAFNVKHNTEFSSWLAKSEVSTKYKDREEILQMEGVVSALACQLHSKTQIAENLETILDGGQRDIRRLSSVVSMSDLEDVDETITFNASNVNMSRAPAAS